MKDELFSVTLPPNKRPGIVRVGSYVPGQTYDVDAAEAVRLADIKGFEFKTAPDEKKARAIVAGATRTIPQED